MVFLFLGFPFFWDKFIALATGLLIVVFTYSIRNNKDSLRKVVNNEIRDRGKSFVEHRGVPDRSITSDPTTTG